MASYLEVESDLKGHLMKDLIIPGSEFGDVDADYRADGHRIKPEPGLCVKVKTVNGDKIFINLCCSLDLPPPRDINEDELISILESDTPSGYKVPLSLGDAHRETDKSDQSCSAYDVIINKSFFHKIEKNELFKTFVISVAMEGLETKHGLELNKQDFVVLKNKLYFGTIQTAKIKTLSGPLVAEFENKLRNPIVEINSSNTPKFEMRFKRRDNLLTVNIELPKVKLISDIILDLGEDHIVLKTTGTTIKYFLDIYIPILIKPESATAEFDSKLQRLLIKVSVLH